MARYEVPFLNDVAVSKESTNQSPVSTRGRFLENYLNVPLSSLSTALQAHVRNLERWTDVRQTGRLC